MDNGEGFLGQDTQQPQAQSHCSPKQQPSPSPSCLSLSPTTEHRSAPSSGIIFLEGLFTSFLCLLLGSQPPVHPLLAKGYPFTCESVQSARPGHRGALGQNGHRCMWQVLLGDIWES